MTRLIYEVQDPIPPSISKKFGPPDFYYFGKFCFFYDQYAGPVHYLNAKKGMLFPEDPANWTHIKCWLEDPALVIVFRPFIPPIDGTAGILAGLGIVAPGAGSFPGILP